MEAQVVSPTLAAKRKNKKTTAPRLTFPVPTAPDRPPHRADDGAEQDVGALLLELAAHAEGALVRQGLVPAGTNVDAARPRTDKVGVAEALAGVCQAHSGEVEARYGWDAAWAAGR